MNGKQRTKCDKWTSGLCRAWSDEYESTLYCPLARANHAGPGECVHHPLRQTRIHLTEMKRAGVDVAKHGNRLRSPVFVSKLYRSWLRKSGKSN